MESIELKKAQALAKKVLAKNKKELRIRNAEIKAYNREHGKRVEVETLRNDIVKVAQVDADGAYGYTDSHILVQLKNSGLAQGFYDTGTGEAIDTFGNYPNLGRTLNIIANDPELKLKLTLNLKDTLDILTPIYKVRGNHTQLLVSVQDDTLEFKSKDWYALDDEVDHDDIYASLKLENHNDDFQFGIDIDYFYLALSTLKSLKLKEVEIYGKTSFRPLWMSYGNLAIAIAPIRMQGV